MEHVEHWTNSLTAHLDPKVTRVRSGLDDYPPGRLVGDRDW
jgi:hypothetical protein